MNAKLVLGFARMWWAGLKVLCRWFAFYIVLAILSLPVTGLAYLIGDRAEGIPLVVFVILVTPIVFYLTSNYLLLLGDEEQAVAKDEGPAGGHAPRDHRLRMKILVSTGAAFVSFFFLTPSPDPLSVLIPGAAAAFVCGVSLLVLAQFHFMKSSPNSVQTLVCVLVCLGAILSAACFPFLLRILMA